MRGRLERAETWGLLGVLMTLVVVVVPQLGSEPWPFQPAEVEPRGILGPLVRAAGREWDLGVPRGAALLAGLLVVATALAVWLSGRLHRGVAVCLAAAAAGLILFPASLLAVGMRDATDPWQFTNDSTYQIEIAGDMILDGETPYGRNYDGTGLERFYSAAGFDESTEPQVALTHFAYFPGTPLTAAVWRLLPRPLDDYRLFVLLATVAAALIVLLFPAPLSWRLAGAAIVAANPLAVRATWFGTADMPSLALVLLAFLLAVRGRPTGTAAAIAGAVLLKQFAIVALPFLAVLLLTRGATRPVLVRAAVAFSAVVVAGFLPFLIADPSAVWDDTVAYGTGTYRIIGYGLAGLLVGAGLAERDGDYPFALFALLVWVPATAWLLLGQVRSREVWQAAAGFAVSIFVLLYVSRVLQNSYLVWPLVAGVAAFLLAAVDRAARGTNAYSFVEPTR